MRKIIINLLFYLFTFGLCIFLIWYGIKDLTPEQSSKIKFAISKAKFILLIPIFIMGIISHWSRAARWKILMQPLGINPRTMNVFFAVMVGYFANLLLPRMGEVIKCTILAKYEKTPADKLVGTIIAERAFDLLCLLIILAITILIQTDLASSYAKVWLLKFNGNESSNTKYFVLGFIALLIVLIYVFKNQIGQIKFIQKIKTVFVNILSGIMSFKLIKNKNGFIFHTLLIWSMYLSMIILGFQSISETSMLGFKTSMSVLSFGSFGMIATPGGIGAYPLLVEEIVQLYGVEGAYSLAISWIIWLVPTVIIILVGLFSLIYLPIYNSNKDAK